MGPGTCKVADNLGPSWNTLITPVTLRTIVVMVIIVVVLIAVSVLVNTDDGSGNSSSSSSSVFDMIHKDFELN